MSTASLAELRQPFEAVIREMEDVQVLASDAGGQDAAEKQAGKIFSKLALENLAPLAAEIIDAVGPGPHFPDETDEPPIEFDLSKSVSKRYTGFADEARAGKTMLLWLAMSLDSSWQRRPCWERPHTFAGRVQVWSEFVFVHYLEDGDDIIGARCMGHSTRCLKRAFDSLCAPSTVIPLADGVWPPNKFAWKTKVAELSAQPFRIMDTLYSRPGKTMRQAEFILAIWGRDDVKDNTVNQALNKVRRALEAKEVGADLGIKNGFVTLELFAE